MTDVDDSHDSNVPNGMKDSEENSIQKENQQLKLELRKVEDEKSTLVQTVTQLKKQLQTNKNFLENEQNRNRELQAKIDSLSGATGDEQNKADSENTMKEINSLKKRNSKLEKDLKTLKEKLNNQAKELKKCNSPFAEIEKTIRELDKTQQQNANLKSSLQRILKGTELPQNDGADDKDQTMPPEQVSTQAGKPSGRPSKGITSGPESNSQTRRGRKGAAKVEAVANHGGPVGASGIDSQKPVNKPEQGNDGERTVDTHTKRITEDISVDIEIWTPSEEETEWELIELKNGERTWREFFDRVKGLSQYCDESAVVVTQFGELLIDKENRVTKAIQVADPVTRHSDLRTREGVSMDKDAATHSFRLFLHPDEEIKMCPNTSPILTVLSNCSVMSENRRSRRYELIEVEIERIFEPNSLLLIWGLYLYNYENESETIFIQLNGRCYCETRSGRVYEKEADVYAGYGRDNTKFEWNYLLIVVNHGDRIPFYNVPEKIPVAAYTRLGAELEFSRGKLYSLNRKNNGLDGMWICTKSISEVDQQLTKTMRNERYY